MWLGKSLVGDRPSWHKEPIIFFNKMLSIRKVRLLITSRYIAMQSYECVIISTMFLIYFISYGCNDSALVFLGGAEASASPSFALPMFITIKKIIILHLFLGVPAATVGGTGTPWHTRGYAPALNTFIWLMFTCFAVCFISVLKKQCNVTVVWYLTWLWKLPLRLHVFKILKTLVAKCECYYKIMHTFQSIRHM